MKNKLWKQWMLSGVLVSAMVVSCGVSVSVQAEETTETEEAAEETAAQLRLRNISGIVIIDFINLEQEAPSGAFFFRSLKRS